ncbi:hypothetical protein NGC36_12520 [Serratia rubidaea]|uniref:hypothetical protein n=1 Tax=Serratia rubidaea TaxID=61652 RepID=UPI002DBEDB02|nr:hypothetical protein [Serratia rubidaea]MEB7586100.1 hypothetical protein [Serratia rubidaea]
MSMNVYFVASPSQDAWIDFTLAVTEVFWLLPDEARPEGITEAGQLFDGMIFETAGLRVSPEPEENIPMQPVPYVEERVEFFQRPDFFHRLVLILIHNLCPGSVRIERNDTRLSKYPGWELPLLWLRHHLNRPELVAPEDVDEATMTDGSTLFYLAKYSTLIDYPNDLPCHWRVIVWMDEVLTQRLSLAHSAA